MKSCDDCGYQEDNWHYCRTLKDDIENCPEFYRRGPRLTCAACGKVTDSVRPFCADCSQNQ